MSMHVQEARVNAGLPMEELSILAEIPEGKLSRIQSGKINPTPAEAQRIAEACGVSLQDIEWGEPEGGFRRRLVFKAGHSRRPDRAAQIPELPESNNHHGTNGTAAIPAASRPESPPGLAWLLDQVVRNFGIEEATRRLLGK
jgi:transcriptional regulator with XRE-family HTH domain